MATTRSLILFYVLLVGVVFSSVNALGFSSEGQEQDLGQSQGQGRGQSTGSFDGGRQGVIEPSGSISGSAGYPGAGVPRPGAEVPRPGAEGRSYGGSQYGGQPGGEDARQYNFRIYTEPEYYGYESKFPGGRATFKSYRSAESRLGRQGQQSEYSDSGRNSKSYDNFGTPENQQPQY